MDSILANFLGIFNVIFFIGNIARIISEKRIIYEATENLLKNKYTETAFSLFDKKLENK